MIEQAQALIDALHAEGYARIVAGFNVLDDDVSLTFVEVYKSVPHQDGVHADGNPLEGLYFEGGYVDAATDPFVRIPYESAAASAATIELLRARYGGKRASGVLKVNEENRVWADSLTEEELGDPDLSLKVEL